MTDSITAQHVESLRSIGALKEAVLTESLSGGRVRCNICQRRCVLSDGGVGYCRTKVNYQGTLYSTIYGVISSAAADPIEKKPVFHYKPGSMCFSVGTLGCNFRCVFCQNWQIAYADALSESDTSIRILPPSELARLANHHHCTGVAWTYNEPSIWLTYMLDAAKCCKDNSLYTVSVTNGYATPEALDLIAPYLDVYRVDVKSMDDHFYKELAHIPSAQGILDVAQRAKAEWGIHVECVTNIIPGWNDSEDNLTRTASWIRDKLGPDTPWHISRFFPYGELSHIPPTPPATLESAVEIGRQTGLHFVYLGNIATETGEDTYCPTCGSLNVRRTGYTTQLVNLDENGNCGSDHTNLNIHI